MGCSATYVGPTNMFRNILMLGLIIFTIAGCKDRYDEGYATGYADSSAASGKIAFEKAMTTLSSATKSLAIVFGSYLTQRGEI